MKEVDYQIESCFTKTRKNMHHHCLLFKSKVEIITRKYINAKPFATFYLFDKILSAHLYELVITTA